MKTITLTKSDFKHFNLTDREVRALVFGFADFNYDEHLRLNLDNSMARVQVEFLIEDMVNFIKAQREDWDLELDCDYEIVVDRLVRMLQKKEDTRASMDLIMNGWKSFAGITDYENE